MIKLVKVTILIKLVIQHGIIIIMQTDYVVGRTITFPCFLALSL